MMRKTYAVLYTECEHCTRALNTHWFMCLSLKNKKKFYKNFFREKKKKKKIPVNIKAMLEGSPFFLDAVFNNPFADILSNIFLLPMPSINYYIIYYIVIEFFIVSIL